jgi:hypothetical protein
MGVCSDMLEVILAPIMGQSQSEANQKTLANGNLYVKPSTRESIKVLLMHYFIFRELS